MTTAERELLEAMQAVAEKGDRLIAELETDIAQLREGVWVRATTYHDGKEHNARYHDDEYGHQFIVEAFDHDPGEYSHEHGTPDQFRVRVPIQRKPA